MGFDRRNRESGIFLPQECQSRGCVDSKPRSWRHKSPNQAQLMSTFWSFGEETIEKLVVLFLQILCAYHFQLPLFWPIECEMKFFTSPHRVRQHGWGWLRVRHFNSLPVAAPKLCQTKVRGNGPIPLDSGSQSQGGRG